MTVEQMRDSISNAYDGPRWKNKVARMPESQVLAIFYKFEKENRDLRPKKVSSRQTIMEEFR